MKTNPPRANCTICQLATSQCCTMGEVLYLPSLWYHGVEQSEQTIAVNFWFDMKFDIKFAYFKFQEAVAGLVDPLVLHPEQRVAVESPHAHLSRAPVHTQRRSFFAGSKLSSTWIIYSAIVFATFASYHLGYRAGRHSKT
eukprot:g45992.t1